MEKRGDQPREFSERLEKMTVSNREINEINEVAERAMTVRHILEALEGADPDARVFFVCTYGDYHNTQQALPVGEVIEDCSTANLATSAYSQSGLSMLDDDSEPREFPDDEEQSVVILRT